ncbi:MAG TPA: sigma-70 family RNA polymerase sigma factor [Pirellulales bacterium]|jgi:RNA polymerase sigma-70 factor (ECF subfamily)|nr:sigma-70 family RNA polymerase sigma factor [Pirellulales bacterium]
MPPTATDSHETRRLLERAAAGDREAFDRLFELHRKSLKRLVALRMDARLRTRLDPSDVVQETHMVAFRRFADYLKRRPMPFRLWLRKTAQQQVCDAQRTHIERHRRSLLREEAGLSRSSRLIARGLLSARSSPSEKLQRRESERRVASAVAELSDADREIVVMRNVEGLTFEEIAPVLEMQPPAVRQRYGRALIKLRAKLKDQA